MQPIQEDLVIHCMYCIWCWKENYNSH